MSALVSYAQNFEDVMLWRALKHVEKGRYIDVGAQGPTIDSVSKLFHEQGWQGIHVEPTPHYAEQLRQGRPGDIVLQTAVGNKVGTIRFYEFPDTGLSTDDRTIAKKHLKRGFPGREIVVPCITLDNVFENFSDEEIHWLKIDVEGGEQRVLKGWTQSNARPWIVLIESTLPLTQVESHEKWEAIVLSKGYKFAYFDGLNRFYVADGHADLFKAFSAGPNLFDGFLLTHNSWPWCTNLNTQIRAAEEKIEIERQAAAALLLQRETELQALIRASQAATAQNNIANAAAQAELTDRLVASQHSAVDAARVLAATEETFGKKLETRQADSVRLAQDLARREQEFSAQVAAREHAHRTEISSLQAETVRASGLLIAAKDEFARVLHAAQQQALKSVQALAMREQEFSEHVVAREHAHRDESSSLQAEAVRASGLLIAAKDEFARVLHAAQQESLKAAQALAAHEREVGTRLLAQEQEFRKMQSTTQSEIVRVTRLLAEAKDEHAVIQRGVQQQLLNADKLLLDSEERTRAEVNRLVAREREFGEQLIARADAVSTLQRETKHEQTTLLQEISTIRENARLFVIEQQQREQILLNEVSAGIEKRIQMEHSQARIRQELEERHAQAANRVAQLQQMLSVALRENAGLRSTFSWRLTAPLRAIAHRWKRIGTQDIAPVVESGAQSNTLLHTGPDRISESNPTHADSGNLQKAPMLSADTLRRSPTNISHAHDLGELLSFDGEQFIECAYLTLLKRAPDSSGGKFYFDRLIEGVGKIQILGEIGSSEEAQRPAVPDIAELLSVDGEQFIECAYFTLLDRLPDSSGGQFYLHKLFKGVAKIQILDEIGSSEEAILSRCTLPGLQHAIARHRRARRPLRGLFVRLSNGVEGDSAAETRLRSVEQHLRRMEQRSDASHAALAREIRALANPMGPDILSPPDSDGILAEPALKPNAASLPELARSIFLEQVPLKAGAATSVIAQLSFAVKKSIEAQQLSIHGDKK